MTDSNKEIEVKFYLTDPDRFTNRLLAVGAELMTPRCHEHDLRFDNDTNSLQAAGRVLRLRQDWQTTLTYKGPGELLAGVSARHEIEVGISDFGNAQKLLQALGYKPVFAYEKYRTTYVLKQCEIVLDEMPFGWFCEIEGDSPEMIRSMADELGLRWDSRIVDSYAMLFRHCQQNRRLTITDLTFANFTDLNIKPQDLGVCPADGD
jgi:adenylate cyclase class 2